MTPMQTAFHHLGELANPNSGELIVFDGPLNLELLRNAISCALKRHPLLNSVPKKHRGVMRWREAVDALPVELRVYETQETDESRVRSKLWRHLWAEKLPAEGRQVRFIYTQGPRRSYLQICAPHTVTDACSGTRLAADIGNAYGALCEGKLWRAKTIVPLERPVKDVFLKELSLWRRARLIGTLAKHMVRDVVADGAGLNLEVPKEAGPTEVSVTPLCPKLLSRTIKVARRQNTTAHSLFLLALSRARTEMVDPITAKRPLRLNDFATLRPFADRDVSDAFDVLVVPNQITIDPNWDDETALKTLSSHIRKQKQGGVLSELYRLSMYGALARFLPTRLTAGLVFKYVNKSDIAVTNPGRVPWQDELERFGDVKIVDFINFPHLLPPTKVVLIFTTFRGSLRIVQLYDSKAMPEGVEETLVQPFIRHLEQLLDTLDPPDRRLIRLPVPLRSTEPPPRARAV